MFSQVDSYLQYGNIKNHAQIVGKDVMKELGKVASLKLRVSTDVIRLETTETSQETEYDSVKLLI